LLIKTININNKLFIFIVFISKIRKILNIVFYNKFYLFLLKCYFLLVEIFFFLKKKEKNYEKFINENYEKFLFISIKFLEIINFSILKSYFKFLYKYFVIPMISYFFSNLKKFKYIFLIIIDNFIPYLIKLLRFFVISILEPYIKINFWRNYFLFKLEIIKINLIRFYDLLEFLKINLIKKNFK